MTRLVYSKNAFITISFQKEGVHCYPAAKDIPGVEFLANLHRHIFHFSVTVEVKHDDRDIEFILLKRELENLYTEETLQLNHKSCEMLADELAVEIIRRYPDRNVSVTVSEDGENGGTVQYYRRPELDNDDNALSDPNTRVVNYE